jgi:hypothetical protein
MNDEPNSRERLGKAFLALALFTAEVTLLVQWGLTAS